MANWRPWTGKPCKVGGCDSTALSFGMCDKHYRRWKLHGTTDQRARGPQRKPRRCPCGEVDPTNFHPHQASECKKCHYERSKRWRAAHPERVAELTRNSNMKRHYGITPERYEEMVREQGGGCAACGGPPTRTGGGTVRFVVDHDHGCCPGIKSCGHCVRGLLCNACNRALGYAVDSPDRLERLRDYLVRSSKAFGKRAA